MCLALPGRVLDIHGEALQRAGRVDFGGVVRQVSLALVPEAGVADLVLVHAGVAIACMDATRAAATREALGLTPLPEHGADDGAGS